MHRGRAGQRAVSKRAQEVGHAVDRAFWHRELGGYTLEADVTDQYAAYGVWVSEALLDLYAVDRDPFWLERARANFDALHERFRDGDSGAYLSSDVPVSSGASWHSANLVNAGVLTRTSSR